MSKEETIDEYIGSLINRARSAQKIAESFSQDRVLELARAIAYTAICSADLWAELAMNEIRIGDIASKIARINDRPRGVLKDLIHAKTVGIIEEDLEKKIIKIAKPVGVIGGIVPMTVPETVPIIKGMNALMGRNAIIFCPHPRAKKIVNTVVNEMRKTLKIFNAPEDLCICIENPTKDISFELMKQCDLIIATGGSEMVRAAYSSGKPAYGVGVGNVVSVIDETADIKDAAHKIMESQINDLATGCSTENSLVIHHDVYDKMIQALKEEKGYLCSSEEKQRLQDVLWTDGHLNPDIICKPASEIAKASSIKVSDDCTFIMVEESGYGHDYPFSGEKLSVVLAVYRYFNFEDAIALVNSIQIYQGAGHSCGIHSQHEEHIMQFAMKTKTSRVMINSPQNKANAGSFKNGMPFTITLGCGTWGGNITNENITYKHYINTTWVSRWLGQGEAPDDQTLFGNVADRFHQGTNCK